MGVTENTELAQSTTSQTQHSNQFNVNATASGGIGFVTGSISTSFGTQGSSSQSASDSAKHAIATTRKASARVKQSHKVTISTTTVTGSSETTMRILQNPSTTDPIRIDYFSLMRQWYVGLYRYGLRLTYDIAITEPGGTLRDIYRRIDDLQQQIAGGFNFPHAPSYITRKIGCNLKLSTTHNCRRCRQPSSRIMHFLSPRFQAPTAMEPLFRSN
jgi:hypothetical protein